MVEKWRYSDLPKYSKNGILSLFDLLTLFAYKFFSLKASKTQLVSSERSFKKLSEAHEFHLNWLKNGDTVLSQSIVKKWNLSLFDLSTLFAHNFLYLKASKTRLVSSERSFKRVSEAHEFQLNWLKYGDTAPSQSTVKKWNLSLFDLSTLFAYNFLSLKASKTRLVSSERSFKSF